ncbi:hypothetical protein ACFVYD_03815 [Streptomyces sp. NPDC058301]|uniref:hypothetical protein n=1 Tax=Streptomyces sp. NPDC058301 TaxID=3346436 RepID=UPI0036E729B3
MDKLIKQMTQDTVWTKWVAANSAQGAKEGCISAAPKSGCISAVGKTGCIS